MHVSCSITWHKESSRAFWRKKCSLAIYWPSSVREPKGPSVFTSDFLSHPFIPSSSSSKGFSFQRYFPKIICSAIKVTPRPFSPTKLYQMDVKSAFLNDFIDEVVYVHQPPEFEDMRFPNHVYRLKKSLYGLKQAPRAWYEHLWDFLIMQGFKIGRVDTTLFTKDINGNFFICQIEGWHLHWWYHFWVH